MTDGPPIDARPKSPIPDGLHVGARIRPDGTLDLSRALRMQPGDNPALQQPEAAAMPAAEDSSQAELESKATDLAKLTREKGFGIIFGYLNSIYPSHSNFTRGASYGEGFAMGEALPRDSAGIGATMANFIDMKINWLAIKGIYDSYHDNHRQWWISSRYAPTIENKTFRQERVATGRGFLGRKVFQDTYIPEITQIPKRPFTTPSGRQISGGPDWIHYTCQMPHIPSNDERPGHAVQLEFVVPPDVASQLDQAVSANPLFPDRFFQAIYPGVIGEDNKTHIRRKPATELAIVNNRDPKHKTVEVKPYPQPIPF